MPETTERACQTVDAIIQSVSMEGETANPCAVVCFKTCQGTGNILIDNSSISSLQESHGAKSSFCLAGEKVKVDYQGKDVL